MYSSICQVGGSKDHLAAAMEQMEHAKTVEAAAQLDGATAAGGNGHRHGKEFF